MLPEALSPLSTSPSHDIEESHLLVWFGQPPHFNAEFERGSAMIDVDEHLRRFVPDERHFLLDRAKAELAKEFETGQHGVLKFQLRTLRAWVSVQHVSCYLFGGNQYPSFSV